MSKLLSALAYGAAFLVLPVLVGSAGMQQYLARERPTQLPYASAELLARAPRPAIDPTRATVVVVLGADLTEVTDALGPYEIFARARGFNVITAAPERRPTLFSGGLAVLPHYSLPEVDTLLGGRSADVVVVPNIPNIRTSTNAPIVAWLRKQASGGALMHSWCKGAMALAEAGLLDGRAATAHWGDIAKLERLYPGVSWRRGVRWVEHDGFVLSAGITSGIDASLRVLRRLLGDDTARRVADEIRYPNYRFVLEPNVEQYTIMASDAVLLANAAFGVPRREQIGLALYPGVGEIDISNVYDAHAYVMTAGVAAVGRGEDVIQSEHGLTLLPRTRVNGARELSMQRLDRLLVPGARAGREAADLVATVKAHAPSLPIQYLHAHEPERFGLEPVLEDLALTSDVMTAQFAQRRMEYRSRSVRLQGARLPWLVFASPLLLGAVGVLVLWGVRRSGIFELTQAIGGRWSRFQAAHPSSTLEA